jgi:hypothetical protein
VARQDEVKARVAQLIAGFEEYVQAYDDNPPFSSEQLRVHRGTVALRQQVGSVRSAVESATFTESLYLTLRKWRIGQRQSKLVPLDDFRAALRAGLPRMEHLERLAINGTGLPADLTERIWQLVYSLGVVENNAKIVAGTKTLHHLLPELVPPMDRDYTRAFFGFPNPALGDYRQSGVFREMYDQLTDVARQVRPERYVTGSGWRTSRTKVLDNAVVAFLCIESGKIEPTLDDASGGETANNISFDVPGLPPAKDGGTSIFNVRHTHLPRVRALLEAAKDACATQDFTPVESGRVGLNVILYTPSDLNPADNANYVGGIADVLEHKGTLDIDHLGTLASVWLYTNDRQIKEITFREVDAQEIGYSVTVRELSS